MRRLSPLLLLALAAVAVLPRSAQARTLEVGEGKEYAVPSLAIKAAKDGDTVLIAPGTYYDCAAVGASNLTIAGASADKPAILTDTTCMGKALLITVGSNITVRNLVLQRARVPDGNGAGIRAEGHDLTVDHVQFIDNQNGILAADRPDGTIIIRNSTFDRNGFCDRACAHGIYVGKLKLLHIENSTFTGTKRAHHIKSRAARTEVIGCHISDGPDGTASYHIDASNGGAVVVRNSVFEKGPQAENHTAIIMIGEEGVNQPTPEITIENNTARNDGDFPTVFVYNQTATEAMLKGNKLSGKIVPLHGDGKVQ
jgi:hypothetical protein